MEPKMYKGYYQKEESNFLDNASKIIKFILGVGYMLMEIFLCQNYYLLFKSRNFHFTQKNETKALLSKNNTL